MRRLSPEIFVFLIVLLVTIILMTIYNIIKPEISVPFNFSPYPNIQPSSLPDAQTGDNNCLNSLSPCDIHGQCSQCGEKDFTCTEVDVDGQYVFNNMNVPAGKWCLPNQNASPSASCNQYTGRWTWVDDPVNCPGLNGGKQQCWKCICLYPELYGGVDCREKVACINTSSLANNVDQSNNKLVGTKYCGYEGQEWDPTGENSELLRVNPYSTDSKGNPCFACSCNTGYNTRTNLPSSFLKLPNDPYSCHLDMCWASNNYIGESAGYCSEDCCDENGCKSNCCACDCSGNAKVNIGTLAGTCFDPKLVCGTDNSWNDETETCNCPSTGYGRPCYSKYVSPEEIANGLPTCTESNSSDDPTCLHACADYNNPVGQECHDLCTNKCDNGGKCYIQNEVAYCDCTTAEYHGCDQYTASTCSQNCDSDCYNKCAENNGAYPKLEWEIKNSGTCDTACLPSGTIISRQRCTSTYGDPKTHCDDKMICYPESTCCSGKVSQKPCSNKLNVACESGDQFWICD